MRSSSYAIELGLLLSSRCILNMKRLFIRINNLLEISTTSEESAEITLEAHRWSHWTAITKKKY